MAETAEADKWIETFRGAVLASEYDPESSMNTRLYSVRFDQATWFLLHAVGITPKGTKAAGRRVAVVRQNFQFIRELHGGELIVVKSGFIAVGKKHFRFLHRMFDVESGDLLATSDCTAVQASLETGRTVPLPGEQAARIQARVVTEAAIEEG